MSQVSIKELENSVSELVTAYQHLRVENKTLTQEYADLSRKHTETRHRLQAVIARIKALEEEAEAQSI